MHLIQNSYISIARILYKNDDRLYEFQIAICMAFTMHLYQHTSMHCTIRAQYLSLFIIVFGFYGLFAGCFNSMGRAMFLGDRIIK